MNDRKLLLKPSEAAELLGVGPMRVLLLIQEGRIPVLRVGKRVRIPVDALREWVRREAGDGSTAARQTQTLKSCEEE
jgi:excisionase family DNA binding protein